MSNVLLALPDLPDGTKDLTVGEPYLIRENLLSMIDMQHCMPNLSDKDFAYLSPTGNKELVSYLEERHQAPVVITSGAKQALGATFYALKKMGRSYIKMLDPYWALIPPLAKMHGLIAHPSDPFLALNDKGAYLLIAPNNPDGSIDDLDLIDKHFKLTNIPLIHDGAYYTYSYINRSVPLKQIGDVQIFSMSKMLGLSSLRVGYAVCHNQEMYKHILDYMEQMTVGVSNVSQLFLLNIFESLESKQIEFEDKCFNDLKENKRLVKTINSNILEVPDNIEDVAGMFLWAKCKDFGAFKKAKLHIISGEPFGDKDYVRINLGFRNEDMKDIVQRINSI